MRQHLSDSLHSLTCDRIGGGQHDIAVGRLQSRILDDLSLCLLTSECMLGVRHMMRMCIPCKIDTAVKCQFCYTLSEVTTPGAGTTQYHCICAYALRVKYLRRNVCHHEDTYTQDEMSDNIAIFTLATACLPSSLLYSTYLL